MLKNLERIGLADRRTLQTPPPTAQYSLAGDGQKLRKHLIPLLVWVSERGVQDLPGCPIRMRKGAGARPGILLSFLSCSLLKTLADTAG